MWQADLNKRYSIMNKGVARFSIRRCTIFVAGWFGFNICAIVFLESREKRSAEIEFGLPKYSMNQFLEERIRGKAATEVRYRLLRPDRLEKGRSYPVIIFLHGSGEAGNDNVAQLRGLPADFAMHRFREKYQGYWVLPQCPLNCKWQSFLQTSLGDAGSDSVGRRLVAAARKQPQADMNRIYLLGYSMGSFGTWQWLAEDTDSFAAAIPVSGGESSKLAPRLTYVPIRTIHGVDDNVCSVEATQKLVAGIRADGGNVTFFALENTGHHAWPELLNDESHFQWLFSQRKSQTN